MRLQILGTLIVAALSIGAIAKEPVKLAQAKPEEDKKQKQAKQEADIKHSEMLANKGRKLIIGDITSDEKKCFPFC